MTFGFFCFPIGVCRVCRVKKQSNLKIKIFIFSEHYRFTLYKLYIDRRQKGTASHGLL